MNNHYNYLLNNSKIDVIILLKYQTNGYYNTFFNLKKMILLNNDIFLLNKILNLSNFNKLYKCVVYDKNIIEIINYPNTLTNLELNNTKYLIKIPDCIKELTICNIKSINKLNNLPILLTKLICSCNRIINLDYLPSSLINLNCKANRINYLNNLPSNLKLLDCSFNNIKKLDYLPIKLYILFCQSNDITKIINLPKSLIIVDCSNNNLITKPKCYGYLILLNYSLDYSKSSYTDNIIFCVYKFIFILYVISKIIVSLICFLIITIYWITIRCFLMYDENISLL